MLGKPERERHQTRHGEKGVAGHSERKGKISTGKSEAPEIRGQGGILDRRGGGSTERRRARAAIQKGRIWVSKGKGYRLRRTKGWGERIIMK